MRRRRRIAIVSIVALGLIAAAFSLYGCTTTIVPPTGCVDPVSVYLVDYGRHASLLLPGDTDNAMIEYAYGDWDWFAQDKSKWHDVFGTLLWPTQGALGRWKWTDLEPDAEALQWRIVCQEVYEIPVESARATALADRLEKRYRLHIDTEYYQARYQLDFVHDDERYWGFHNCNHVVAGWLEELDCEVRGFAMFAVFEVRRQDERPE